MRAALGARAQLVAEVADPAAADAAAGPGPRGGAREQLEGILARARCAQRSAAEQRAAARPGANERERLARPGQAAQSVRQ